MDKAMLLGTWIRRFLLEHLVAERNLAHNTQRSYRDTLVLLIPFVAKKAAKAVDRLSVVDMSAELIRLFLADLETSRRCAIVTRNQRLAAIHALARFVGEHSPEHILDLEMKAKALATCQVAEPTKRTRPWREDPELMTFLGSL